MTTVATVDAGILERSGVHITPTSLTVTNPDLPYPVMEELVVFVSNMEDSCRWWIADLLISAESIYGEQFSQLEHAAHKLSAQTLSNRCSIARRVPPERRRQPLSLSHHAEVAYLDPTEQDRYLDEAERNQWTRAQLREAIRTDRAGPPPAIDKCVCPLCLTSHQPNSE